MKKLQIAIIGASGYTGAELVRILLNHKKVEIAALVANSNAGQKIEQLYPHLIHYNLPDLKTPEEIDFTKIDLAFGCLPHTTSQEVFKKLLAQNSHLKVIDLSADFRLENPSDYAKWYEHEHSAQSLQPQAIYGLSEIHRNKIKKSNLIACPGCYPTSALLSLIPLLQNNLIEKHDIIIDSKSGVTGAGRSVKQSNLFCEINESVKAYSVGKHRHTAEIEQELAKACGEKIEVDFTPHLLPINRGIISTIYAKTKFSASDIQNCLEKKYEDEPFVKVISGDPNIKDVVGTNFCIMSVKAARTKGKVIIVSVIDNLCKGASGQAVQNMNIVFGFDEREGLEFVPLFP
ncbi:MAG: N-acetyl-gamma-glutamyl-phosphate reductase [Alphaproteobacteria bacterium RIFCSPLOWO2_01_FULL_40_26]|nr:MAG: N-acetyl-gamma-glutamyl-phosphate reductase [Alphaproteobacteria bacterium RIFCSPHIGHO2_02_FULL_40_34]OFW94868.1 MAG: N-acetyl-gamma-glutamyl-phosphate reductase [Alphaproteobacteria bacterium RIFCSPLOWO2_01_FULL_40_26]OFX10494.1 MAG: N-acetyl-gamma-glutamyl-phosphate reductase [Alphaproteobacteria bacterium RIFCSPLOWO2_02_FULL_40_19]OFX10959.1 MAG: N-acetyl-gamma-glutamyl-phosphate reductase [Alphaproteobacteria bacterium RIFCSPLOWO2_12_FULL_40_11]